MGNVFRLCNIIEPFAALFWALGIVLAHILQQVTQPAGLASFNSGTGTVLYSVQQGSGTFNLRVKTRQLLAFPILLYIIYLWHPPSSSIETPFPFLYTCTVGSWQLYRQTATAVYSRQSSYTDREKASQLMTTGGAYMLLQYKDISSLRWAN